jgi:rhodanese-related sulfurtransferase
VDGVAREGWRFVAFTRLVPIFPFNLLNYALGATPIRFLPYLLASAVCMLPGTAAYTYLGYLGREAAGGAEGLVHKGLLGLALLAVALFLPSLVRRLRQPKLQWQTVQALRTELVEGEQLVLDVRSVEEFNGPLGHIPGAHNLPLPNLKDQLQQLQDWKDKPVITVCLTDRRSAEAARLLQAAGWRQVRVLRGGMKVWQTSLATPTPRHHR